MQEIAFSIPVSGVIRINEDSIVVTVNRAETIISIEPVTKKEERISLEKGRTIFDIVLDVAREVIKMTGTNQFSAAELYHQAMERYPDLKRNSWGSHVIACAPNHPSCKHYSSKRDYLSYVQNGRYRLNPKYLTEDNPNEPLFNSVRG